MPYDDPDPMDPMTLHGVGVETSNENATLEMAECFIDEYARLGFDADRILHMFNARGFAGPFMATTCLGAERIRELVDTVLARWGGRRSGGLSRPVSAGDVRLTVLD